MRFEIEHLKDANGNKYWILFTHGMFHEPTAVIEDRDMVAIAKRVLNVFLHEPIEEIGQELRAYRKRKRYSQADMAAIIGISRNYLSQIEQGKANNLSYEVFNKIRMEL